MLRWLFKLLVVAVIIILPPIILLFGAALLRGGGSSAASTDPGAAVYEAMNKEIGSYHGSEAFGNTPQAVAIAEGFAKAMREIREEAFTKGKEGGLSLSKGHFITTCRVESQVVVVLCHVPEFRNFQEDAKAALMGIAWKVAQAAAKDQAVEGRRLVVGLRGVVLYYQYWFGPVSGGTPTQRDAKDGRNDLRLLLAPAPSVKPTDPGPVAPTTAP